MFSGSQIGRFIGRFLVLVLIVAAGSATANAETWKTILTEDFSNPTGWTYSGVQDAGGHNLIGVDSANGKLAATWDQANYFNNANNTIIASSFTKSLGTTLSDKNTFQIGSTIHINSHTDNSSYYQIANFGLYNMHTTAPDRLMTNPNIAEPKNLVEFNYFVSDDYTYGFGPSTQVSASTSAGNYITGSWSAAAPYGSNTDMGCGNFLPAEDLFVVMTYFGGLDSSNPDYRRAKCEIYQMVAGQRQLLVVNGATQVYWTNPLSAGESLELTDVGFFNYAGLGWGYDLGGGVGTFDDLYVNVAVPEPATLSLLIGGVTTMLLRRRSRCG